MRYLALVLASLSCALLDAAEPRPNVLFILADDLGWGDLGCHGSTLVKTPNLDRLAQEGTDFQQFNTTSPVCSASRVGFMTGRFPARFGVRGAIGAVLKNIEQNQVDWLDPHVPTLPGLLRDAGYVTGHCGKWHLQSGQATDAPLPSAYGIDEPALFAGTSHPNAGQSIEHAGIWDAAISFLHRHRDQPFYFNVWCHEAHLAHYPSEDSLQLFAHLDEPRRIYPAVVADLDRGVGRLLAALNELGLAENTLVVFSGDNGPENVNRTQEMRGGYGGYFNAGNTGGLKGRKRSLHEGGVRTPFLVRWPGRVPAGVINTTTSLSATDLLPTVSAATGIVLKDDFGMDGENMLAAFLGEPQVRTKPIFWDWTGSMNPAACWPRWAIRSGDWKLLTDNGTRAELYRVADDRAEQTNLAAEHPDVVARLSAELDAWKASLPDELPAECLSIKRNNRAATRTPR